MKRFAFLSAAILLSSCQPPSYIITASMNAGVLTFGAHNQGVWPLKWNDDEIEAHYLEVVTATEVLWAIQAETDDRGCTQTIPGAEYRAFNADGFPLRYGAAWRCYRTLQAPKALPQGVVILVRTEGLQEGEGQFFIDGSTLQPVEARLSGAPTLNRSWMSVDAANSQTREAQPKAD